MGNETTATAGATRYGEDDLSSWPLFGGAGFINLGLWPDLPPDGTITVEQRVDSQRALYRLALDSLHLSEKDGVVEVGCGLGLGSRMAVEDYGARWARGVDVVPDQVHRAMARNADAITADNGRLGFQHGSADALPFPDGVATAVLSVEAAQHFPDLSGFAREAARVLAPGGRLAVATFFATDAEHVDELARRLESFASGDDLAHPVPDFADRLAEHGFTAVRTRSIGERVWPALDRWMAQLGFRDGNTWLRRWLPTYRAGMIDYYLVTAELPATRS